MDALFGAYAEALPRVRAWVDETFPRSEGEPEAARRRAVNAKALDLLRGLLPAASLSHMGIYATGQAYEQLILHLMADPLPEARAYGQMILDAIKAVDAELRLARRAARPRRRVGRVPRAPPRGDRALGRAPGARPPRGGPTTARRSACSTSTATRSSCSPRCCSRPRRAGEEETLEAVRALGDEERARALADLVGERRNRRHRPGRGFEALRYRFEIVSDYGAFRDLQRHRMLTVQWQALSPDLGADVPEEVAAAGCGDLYAARARALARRVRAARRRRPRPTPRRTRSASATGCATCST